jgi:hypothetical protein
MKTNWIFFACMLLLSYFCHSQEDHGFAPQRPFPEEYQAPVKDTGYYMCLLNSYAHVGSGGFFVGPEISLLLRVHKESRVHVGLRGNYMLLGMVPATVFRNTTASYKLNSWNAGMHLLIQMKDRLFFSVSPQGMFGHEELGEYRVSQITSKRYLTTHRVPIRGLQFDLGICFIALPAQGLYAGGDLSFRATNSEVLQTRTALNIKLGMKF